MHPDGAAGSASPDLSLATAENRRMLGWGALAGMQRAPLTLSPVPVVLLRPHSASLWQNIPGLMGQRDIQAAQSAEGALSSSQSLGAEGLQRRTLFPWTLPAFRWRRLHTHFSPGMKFGAGRWCKSEILGPPPPPRGAWRPVTG